MNQVASEMSALQLYKRLLTYVKPYWLVFGAVILSMLVYAGSETAMAALMKPDRKSVV